MPQPGLLSFSAKSLKSATGDVLDEVQMRNCNGGGRGDRPLAEICSNFVLL